MEHRIDTGSGMAHGVGVGKIATNLADAQCGQRWVVAAVEAEYLMATLNQPTAQRLAEETAAAGYENLHSFWVSCRVGATPTLRARERVRPLPCAAGEGEGRRGVQLLCSIARRISSSTASVLTSTSSFQ